MDRTPELQELAAIMHAPSSSSSSSAAGRHGAMSGLVRRVDGEVAAGEALLARMEKLTQRREFSNDPTTELGALADTFQTSVAGMQRDVELLRAKSEQHLQLRQHRKHYACITSHLSKQIAEQIGRFQRLVEVHSTHVVQRQKRVARYGASEAQHSGHAQAYAMFGEGSDLRKRVPQSARPSEEDRASSQTLLQRPRRTVDAHSLRRTEAIESSLAKMGKLFSEMASLVLEQGETLGRVEDDVEAGLEDTKHAHRSIGETYEMTRGNRAMIVKIFLLLVFFAVLFLVWF